jgi:4'-phosphopantetheinyl transferase
LKDSFPETSPLVVGTVEQIVMQDPRLRWAVEVSSWDPEQEEFELLCSFLPAEDALDVRRFKFRDDQKRAVISRLLQRAAASQVLRLPHADVLIRRTKGRKPYAANETSRTHAPNFNYSVSHEGDYVVLAAEPLIICGCDVAAPQQLRRGNGKSQPLVETLSAFKSQLCASEWEYVFGGKVQGINQPRGHNPCVFSSSWPPKIELNDPEDVVETRFQQIWSLKEAFVKATGEGLGFELGKAEFRIHFGEAGGGAASAAVATARVKVCGVDRFDWAFHLHRIGKPERQHWVAVARAPIDVVVDAWGVSWSGYYPVMPCHLRLFLGATHLYITC